MKPCIYGSDSHPEGTVICVNGRGLKCVWGEWQETDQPCEGEDGAVHHLGESELLPQPDDLATKAKR